MLYNPLREFGKLLIVIGLALALFGAVLMIGPKIPGRIGRLPGDIVIRRPHTTLYFPLVTSLLLSLLLSLILWIASRR